MLFIHFDLLYQFSKICFETACSFKATTHLVCSMLQQIWSSMERNSGIPDHFLLLKTMRQLGGAASVDFRYPSGQT